MSLFKIWLIARREYWFNIRRRAFLFTVFVIPIISLGLSAATSSFSTQQLTEVGNYQHIGVVDQTANHIMSAIALPAPYELVASTDEADSALKAGKLDLYYVLPVNFIDSEQIQSYSMTSVAQGRDDDFEGLIRKAVSANTTDPTVIARLQNPIASLDLRKPGSSHVYGEAAIVSAFFVPFAFGFILFIAINTTSQFLMSGVAEEKENRMMELFITSARPSEMLWGKLFGMGALGLTQLLIWGIVGGAFLFLQGSSGVADILASAEISPELLVLMIAYFFFGYLVNAAIMAAIGATSNTEQESRQIAGIITLIAILPMILLLSLITEPNGTVSVALSMFPLTAPLSMIMRVSFTDVPAWQLLLSLGIMLLSTVLITWIAARIFRLGMLSYGKRLRLGELIRAMREGRQVLTTATTEGKGAQPS